MPKKAAAKCKLKEPGDISISLAPATPKKSKAVPVAAAKKTCSATTSQFLPTLKQTQTIPKPDEDPVLSQPASTTTKASTWTQQRKLATGKEKVNATPKTPDNPTPAEPSLPATKAGKASRSKKSSAIAEKANQQAVAKQNAKEAQAAKKAKKAEEVVIKETPEETAAFLAKVKGQSQPPKTSPNVTSPKRSRPLPNRVKAMEQLLDAYTASPAPAPAPSPTPAPNSGTAFLTTATASDITQAGTTNNLAPQVKKPKLKPKIMTQTSLQAPHSAPTSRDVSPAAPPLLDIPSSTSASREVSPGAESTATMDNDFDKDVDTGVDYKALLDGIPKPWNLGPVSMPPALPEPLHAAKLTPEVLAISTKGGKEKPKVARPLVNNFCVQDRAHLKLSLEYMDAFVATICAFPDDDTRWTFAVLSLPLALLSYLTESRWKPATGLGKAEAEKVIHAKVTSKINDGSFTAPADRPTAYYQNPWFAHILKLAYWQQSTSKGMSEAHAKHFGGGISYLLMALVVTATEKMLAVVAAGPSSANSGHKNPANSFSHARYAPRFNSHLLTLTKLHRSSVGPILTKFLTQLHKDLRAPFVISTPSSHGLQLAIPLSALTNYGGEKLPTPTKEQSDAPEAPVARCLKVRTRPAGSIDLGAILNDPSLNANQKIRLLNIIYTKTEDDSSQTHSTRTTRQYEGLLASVNADSDDSEVEARRAGVLLDTHSDARAGIKVWLSNSDDGATKDGAEGGSEVDEKVEGDGTGSGDGGDDGDSEAEGAEEEEQEEEEEGEEGEEGEGREDENSGDGEVKSRSDGEDESDVEIADKDESEAEGATRETASTIEDEDDANEDDNGTGGSDVDVAPTKPRHRRFFPVDGSLSDPISTDDDGETDSDGEGASGAIATQVDGDQTMMTAVASDEED